MFTRPPPRVTSRERGVRDVHSHTAEACSELANQSSLISHLIRDSCLGN
jgi:hypothetical protein